MGIKNFKSILTFFLQTHDVRYNTICNNELNNECLIIDIMSFFYDKLLNAMDDDVHSNDFYTNIANTCLKKITYMFQDNNSLFTCREIFLSFDIRAPLTKLKTQRDRYEKTMIPIYDYNQHCKEYSEMMSNIFNQCNSETNTDNDIVNTDENNSVPINVCDNNYNFMTNDFTHIENNMLHESLNNENVSDENESVNASSTIGIYFYIHLYINRFI